MEFNVKKCKVMHIGSRNPRYKYDMGSEELLVTEEERDIGVTISSSLKPSAHCTEVRRQGPPRRYWGRLLVPSTIGRGMSS